MLSLANFNFRPEALARYYADVTLADGVCQETCHFFFGNGVGEHANGRVVTPCKGIKDSLGFWILHPGFRIPGTGFRSLLVKFGFWIPIFSRIPDSLSCIPDTKAQDSRFQKKIFPESVIQISSTWSEKRRRLQSRPSFAFFYDLWQ